MSGPEGRKASCLASVSQPDMPTNVEHRMAGSVVDICIMRAVSPAGRLLGDRTLEKCYERAYFFTLQNSFNTCCCQLAMLLAEVRQFVEASWVILFYGLCIKS